MPAKAGTDRPRRPLCGTLSAGFRATTAAREYRSSAFAAMATEFWFAYVEYCHTRLRDLAACFARGLACSFHPLQSEGAGNAGRPMRPIAACAMSSEIRTRVSQVTPESPGIPHAMVLRLPSRSPGRPAFLPPSPAKVAFRDLTPAPGRQDHTTSPSANSHRPSSEVLASTASRSAFRDVAQRPPMERDGAIEN